MTPPPHPTTHHVMRVARLAPLIAEAEGQLASSLLDLVPPSPFIGGLLVGGLGRFIAHSKGKRLTLATETPTTHRSSQGLLPLKSSSPATLSSTSTLSITSGGLTSPHIYLSWGVPQPLPCPAHGRYPTPDDALTLVPGLDLLML